MIVGDPALMWLDLQIQMNDDRRYKGDSSIDIVVDK